MLQDEQLLAEARDEPSPARTGEVGLIGSPAPNARAMKAAVRSMSA